MLPRRVLLLYGHRVQVFTLAKRNDWRRKVLEKGQRILARQSRGASHLILAEREPAGLSYPDELREAPLAIKHGDPGGRLTGCQGASCALDSRYRLQSPTANHSFPS